MRRGFSLLEIVVVCVLLSMVMLLGVRFLVPTLRISAKGTLRVQMQQTAVTALNKLVADYEASSPAGIGTRSGAPVAVSICKLDRVQGDGTDVWSNHFIIYYCDIPTRQLRRREWPPGEPPATTEETSILKARRLLPDRIAAIVAEPAPVQTILAVDVESFRILHPPGGDDNELVQPLRFQLTLKRNDADTLTCTRSAYVRNQR